MFIVAQHNSALHNFIDDDTLQWLYSTPFKQYKPEPSAPHSFKFIVISIEPVVDHCCKNGWEY